MMPRLRVLLCFYYGALKMPIDGHRSRQTRGFFVRVAHSTGKGRLLGSKAGRMRTKVVWEMPAESIDEKRCWRMIASRFLVFPSPHVRGTDPRPRRDGVRFFISAVSSCSVGLRMQYLGRWVSR
jgi:hypothetical protein